MLNASYIKPFLDATTNVFQTMLQLEATPGTPRIKPGGPGGNSASAIIGLSGDVKGAVVVGFDRDTAKRVVSLFVGADLNESDADFSDALGELANMITGSAKVKFPSGLVSISCPSVVIGNGIQICQKHDTPTIEIPFSTTVGEFSVDICIADAPAVDSPMSVAS